MFAIFIEGLHGYSGSTWIGNEPTVEEAKKAAEDYRARSDFAIIVPCAAFLDFDGERVCKDSPPMQYPEGTPLIAVSQKSQRNWIQRNGFRAWADICEKFPSGGTFQIAELINELPSMRHLAQRTQRDFLRLVLHVVILGMGQFPDDYVDSPRLERNGNFYSIIN